MKMILQRRWLTDNSTIGQLYLNDAYECFVLEDCVREIAGRPVSEWKIPQRTAIPYGIYEIVTSFSQRFQRELPLLLNVLGFEGVRFHPGNYAVDTDGCLLPGKTRSLDFVGGSREAFSLLFLRIKRELAEGKIFLEIKPIIDIEDLRKKVS